MVVILLKTSHLEVQLRVLDGNIHTEHTVYAYINDKCAHSIAQCQVIGGAVSPRTGLTFCEQWWEMLVQMNMTLCVVMACSWMIPLEDTPTNSDSMHEGKASLFV